MRYAILLAIFASFGVSEALGWDDEDGVENPLAMGGEMYVIPSHRSDFSSPWAGDPYYEGNAEVAPGGGDGATFGGFRYYVPRYGFPRRRNGDE